MPRIKSRIAVILGETAKIPLGKDARRGYAIVDKEDAWIAEYAWCLSHGYAMTKSVGKSVFMHRFLVNCPDELVIDHLDRNPLNNRRDNLRITTQRNNTLNSSMRVDNTSGHRGVTWDKNRQKWLVRVNTIYIGRFENYSEAIKNRLEAEFKTYGFRIS